MYVLHNTRVQVLMTKFFKYAFINVKVLTQNVLNIIIFHLIYKNKRVNKYEFKYKHFLNVHLKFLQYKNT